MKLLRRQERKGGSCGGRAAVERERGGRQLPSEKVTAKKTISEGSIGSKGVIERNEEIRKGVNRGDSRVK